jgi:hypothetical protein
LINLIHFNIEIHHGQYVHFIYTNIIIINKTGNHSMINSQWLYPPGQVKDNRFVFGFVARVADRSIDEDSGTICGHSVAFMYVSIYVVLWFDAMFDFVQQVQTPSPLPPGYPVPIPQGRTMCD